MLLSKPNQVFVLPKPNRCLNVFFEKLYSCNDIKYIVYCEPFSLDRI